MNLRNPRYVERALEICLLTGKPQSELRQSFQNAQPKVRGLVLSWEREVLWRRIEARTRQMLSGGAIEEVAARDVGDRAGRVDGHHVAAPQPLGHLGNVGRCRHHALLEFGFAQVLAQFIRADHVRSHADHRSHARSPPSGVQCATMSAA